MIESIKRNRMGTVSFKAKFGRMLKPQEFITYAIKEGDDTTKLLIQSDTRIGHIWLKSGIVTMSPPHASGAYGRHLAQATKIDTLTGEELMLLKSHVMASSGAHVGTNGIVYCDNSGAINVGVQV